MPVLSKAAANVEHKFIFLDRHPTTLLMTIQDQSGTELLKH
jgi:hypothetical protein